MGKKRADKDRLSEALLKCALGCRMSESNREYALKDGKMVLIKKKISTKAYPPEVGALKILLQMEDSEICDMTEEDLINEKKRLLGELDGMRKKDKGD